MRKLALSVCILCSAASAPSFAATFNTANVFASIAGSSSSSSVTSVPNVSPVIVTNANGSSTVTPNFTGLVFKTSFSQTISAGTLGAAGSTDVFFQAAAGDTFSLFGSTAPVTGVGTLDVVLRDDTTQTTLYNALTGSATIGSTTGNLTGGDSYDFLIRDDLTLTQALTVTNAVTNAVAAPLATNTGSGGITIVPGVFTPEPATAGMVLVIVGGVLPVIGRRRPRLGQPRTKVTCASAGVH